MGRICKAETENQQCVNYNKFLCLIKSEKSFGLRKIHKNANYVRMFQFSLLMLAFIIFPFVDGISSCLWKRDTTEEQNAFQDRMDPKLWLYRSDVERFDVQRNLCSFQNPTDVHQLCKKNKWSFYQFQTHCTVYCAASKILLHVMSKILLYRLNGY